MHAVIALLTDYGYQDPYVGTLRGVIASRAPSAKVIDLTHGVRPQNIRQASYFLADSFSYYPLGTIFVCVVDPGVGTSRNILCARSKSYYFIAPDNGLLTDVSHVVKFNEIRILKNLKYSLGSISETFHGRDLFAPAASALIVRPSVFKDFGPLVGGFCRLPSLSEPQSPNQILGEIVYFDHFGNAITSVHREDKTTVFWRKAKIIINRKTIGPISKTYGEGKNMLALWSSSGRLEIAVPQGRASDQLEIGMKVKVILEK